MTYTPHYIILMIEQDKNSHFQFRRLHFHLKRKMKRIISSWLYLNLFVFVYCEYDYTDSTDPKVIWQNYKISLSKVYKNLEEDNMR